MSLGDGVVRTHTDANTHAYSISATHPRTVVKMAPRTDGVSQATVNKIQIYYAKRINLKATVVREPPTAVGLWRAKLHVGTSVTRVVQCDRNLTDVAQQKRGAGMVHRRLENATV